MRNQIPLPGKVFLLFVSFVTLWFEPCFGERLLITLQLDSSTVQWQEDFVLRAEIYAPPSDQPPQITIDGLDQFKLRSQGNNLFQVPNGKTVKWILTYRMTATQNGTFKLGPATAIVNGQHYSSNILFLTVEGGTPPPNEKPTVEVPVPIVHSAAEVEDRVLIRMESNKTKAFSREGVVTTLRLLSQLPVENLTFSQEPDFPGFLKYDFPFSAHPKAEKIQMGGKTYASYELQKFLLFPLNDGKILIPAVTCELSLRVPSGKFVGADLMLQVSRTSNLLSMNVLPIPDPGSDLVGSFSLRSEIATDTGQAKVIRYVLEGSGELSTFDLPEAEVSGGQARTLASSTSAEIRGQTLHSVRTTSVEITPQSTNTTATVAQLRISEFDPQSAHTSWLSIPPATLHFLPVPATTKPAPVPPQLQDRLGWILLGLSALAAVTLVLRLRGPTPRKAQPRLHTLFLRKKPAMQISRKAAQLLYQQILQRIAERDGEDISLPNILRKHLSDSSWLEAEPYIRKLEWNAFAPSRSTSLTYGEMKRVCEKAEKRWEK